MKRFSDFSQSQSLSAVCAPSQRLGTARWRVQIWAVIG